MSGMRRLTLRRRSRLSAFKADTDRPSPFDSWCFGCDSLVPSKSSTLRHSHNAKLPVRALVQVQVRVRLLGQGPCRVILYFK